MPENLMQALGITLKHHTLQYNILLPLGKEIQPTRMIQTCTVQFQDRVLYADFIIILMVEFDVILGMD